MSERSKNQKSGRSVVSQPLREKDKTKQQQKPGEKNNPKQQNNKQQPKNTHIFSLNLQGKFRAGRRRNKSNQGDKRTKMLRKTCRLVPTSATFLYVEKHFGTFSSSGMRPLAKVS